MMSHAKGLPGPLQVPFGKLVELALAVALGKVAAVSQTKSKTDDGCKAVA